MAETHTLTLCEAREKLSSGETTPEELLADLFDAIDRHDDTIGAYVHLDRDAIRERAKASGEGTLSGLPIAIKDLMNVAGEPCRCASRILEGYVSPYDATAIANLKQEGAVMAGRVNMDEFAMGSSNENSALQLTRNPWDPTRVPGGSSGGSAAAVAADLALAAIGSDTGGSIRQPAAFCGCVGLKPSYGRVSRYGLTAYASSLDQVGTLTKDVRDAAVLLGVIAGHDPMDSTSIDCPVPNYEDALVADLKGMKLGLPKEYFIEGLDPEIETAVREAVKQCEALGAEIVEVSLPHTPYATATYYIIATAEASANLARFDGVRYGARTPGDDPIDQYGKTREDGFGPEVKRRIILGTYVLSSGYHDAFYLRAQKARTLIRRDFEKAFESCDAILTPTTPTPAFKLGENTEDPLKMYLNDVFTITANLAGLCGISVPCGFTSETLPIGLQVLGPAFGEEAILRTAFAYEQATDWRMRKPVLERS